MMKNILILFTDQQRYDTIGALGNPAIQTPHLDELVGDSTVFRRCITPSPVCVPARFSMYTGQYPARTGNNNNNDQTVYRGGGIYSRLTDHGYQSCCVGKMHHVFDKYGSMGFETRLTQEEMAAPEDDYTRYIRKKYPYVFDYHGMRSEMYYVPQISPLPPRDHPTQWVGDRSVEFIERSDPSRPMLLMASFIHPHPPFSPPAPWQKLYRADPPVPFCPDEEFLWDYRELIGDRCSCKRLMMSDQDVLRMKNFYYACVSFVDYQIGRIIGALKKKGIYEETLILFASDHGDMMGDYHATGKRTMVDASCHIPCVIHYPGRGHERRDDVCSLVDIAPTLLGYAGIAYDSSEFDGIDLFGDRRHRYVYSQYGCGENGVYMVTDGESKLVHHMQSDRYFFFGRVPETENTYSDDDPKVRRMKLALDAYFMSDVNSAAVSRTKEAILKHPHYMGRVDHRVLHEEEAAAIPKEYHIDLE